MADMWQYAQREAVVYKMRQWGMPDDGYEHARAWYEVVLNNSYYTQAILCGTELDGIPGCIVFTSTRQSTRVSQEDHLRNYVGMPVTDPAWLYMEVWWFEGLVVNNLAGITNSKYQGTLLGIARPFFEQEFRRRGINGWEEMARVSYGSHRQPMRQLLAQLGIQIWIEYTFGFSYHGYCAIDAYQRIFCAGMEPPSYAAHYLLNTELPVSQRRHTIPEHWWLYKYWQSYGQTQTVDEWVVLDTRNGPDQSILALRDVPRMPVPSTIIAILRDTDLVLRVYESMPTDEQRNHFARIIQGIYAQARMLTNSNL